MAQHISEPLPKDTEICRLQFLNLILFFWSFCSSLSTQTDWPIELLEIYLKWCEEKDPGKAHHNLCAVIIASYSGHTVLFSSCWCHQSSQLRKELPISSKKSLRIHVGTSLCCLTS